MNTSPSIELRPVSFKHIVIPTDGSPLSAAAVAQGVRFAKHAGARITFLHVGVPFRVARADGPTLADTGPEYQRLERERGERLLDECERVARDAGVKSQQRWVMGEHPYEEIIRTAELGKADLIVMASHGRRGIKALLLGSETQKTLAHGNTPVLVIR